MVSFCLLLGACAVEKKSSVWDTYDVRHPVPAASQVPDSYARQYDQYIDNDSYYAAPDCSIIDSPGCAGD
jgi:hypothetical protein